MTISANERQPMTTSDNEWQRMRTSGTTNDNDWYNEWQRMTTGDNKWQWVTASGKKGTTAKNGTVCFKEWMIAILPIAKIVTLLQGMDGQY